VSCPHLSAGFDFTEPDLYEKRVPHPEFAELRRTAPVSWVEQTGNAGGYGDGGYWAVTKHADVKAISKDSKTYSTWQNTAIIRFNEDMPRESIDLQRFILLNQDPPEHTQLRRSVARGFTPKAIDSLRDTLTERAEHIVARAKEDGSGDFVTDVACELPLQAIAELIGVPQEDRMKLFDWSNQMVAYDDPEYSVDPVTAAAEILGYSMNMAEQRRGCPVDDIVTKLVQADLDGRALTNDEFGFFVILLAVAGNETTRNAISHGMLAFMNNPDQWEMFKADRPDTVADEVVRWATPVTSFQRTTTCDTEINGVPIKKGQRVGLFYGSANFDEEVFDSPDTFDVNRNPNPHLGFGGNGAHFCLGANLARLEIDLMFNAIADAMPDISLNGDASRLRSGWLNGIKHLPVAYG
jgi:cholest-4-en-3-one 26-monooxygenase